MGIKGEKGFKLSNQIMTYPKINIPGS